jgi:hypothetical protein
VIAFVFQVLAWVTFVFAIFGTIGVVAAGVFNIITVSAFESVPGVGNIGGVMAGIMSGVAILVGGILNFLLLLAISDLLYIQIDIEQNTRLTAEYLRQISQAQTTAAVTAAPELPVEPAEMYPTAPTITVPTRPQQNP